MAKTEMVVRLTIPWPAVWRFKAMAMLAAVGLPIDVRAEARRLVKKTKVL